MDFKKQKISSFFREAGFDHTTMEVGKFYPLDEKWEILTRDADGQNTWRRVTHLVRKERTVPIVVDYLDSQILVSPEHKFFARVGGKNDWVEAIELVEERNIFLLHQSLGWIPAQLSEGTEEIDILDMSVEGTECYYSGGILSHNTLYGDPVVTSGGLALPFHASVRIKLGAGQQILDKNKEVVGIHVSAKTVKNKVTAPFRSCNFEIHFGVGIKEHEQLFDILRKHGPEVINGIRLEVGGAGAWKSFTAVREDTGEVLVDKKFYKAEFDKLLSDPEFSEFLDDLLDSAMSKKRNTDSPDVDGESYEEVRSLAMEIDDGTMGISPED